MDKIWFIVSSAEQRIQMMPEYVATAGQICIPQAKACTIDEWKTNALVSLKAVQS